MVLIVSLIGADGFTKVNVPLFAIQFGAIIFGALAMYFGSERTVKSGDVELPVHTWQFSRLSESFEPLYTGTSKCGRCCCDTRAPC